MEDLTADQWKRVETVYERAVEIDTGRRAGFVASACGDDAAVRREVEAMLEGRGRSEGFLASPVLDRSAIDDGMPGSGGDGNGPRRIGPYRLLRRIGVGGMGSVWLAEREGDFERRVAVKLIRRGMDTDDILARFRHERQVLARLEHPNIARLYDGGATDDGQPYLAMEHVEGVPIDRWCEEQGLSIDERLEVFRKVCLAVHHAHTCLVVHRDLKPSNVLVTADGEPKLLDFGIAKVLGAEASAHTLDVTATGARLMTPRYASPEQVRGDPITTASDVYSLGVILYELLTGRAPYDFESGARLDYERAVREQTPTRPSLAVEPPVRRRLGGDVDVIVLMALRKESDRRYVSAEQLAEDIRRHLAGLPVMARPDTIRYRATKFVRRNALAVSAAAVVFLAVVAGLVASTAMYLRAERAAEAARLAEAEARRGSYVANLQAAAAALEAHDVVTAARHLDLAPAEFRGWEWTLLHRRLDRSTERWEHPDGRPVYVTFEMSPDRSVLALGTNRGRIHLWDLATGTTSAAFGDRGGHVRAIAFSPDGRTIAASWGWWQRGRRDVDSPIVLWDVASRTPLATVLRGHVQAVQTLAFGPDGRTLVSGGSDGMMRVWDVTTGAVRHELEAHDGEEIRRVVFAPDGTELVTIGWDGTLRQWDTSGWSLRRSTVVGRRDAKLMIRAMTLDRSGDRIALGTDGGRVQIRARRDASLLTILDVPRGVIDDLAFDATGRRLVSCSMGTVRVWDVEQGTDAVLLGSTRRANGVGFDVEGRHVLSAGEDGIVRHWPVTTDDVRSFRDIVGFVYDAAISPDGRSVSSPAPPRDDAEGHALVVRDTATGLVRRRLGGFGAYPVTAVDWHPDGRQVAAASPRLGQVWDATTGTRLFTLDPVTAHVKAIAYAPDGGVIAAASMDGAVRRWSSDDGRPLGAPIRLEDAGPPTALAWRPDGGELVVGYRDGTVAFWTTTPSASLAGRGRSHAGEVMSVAFSADGMRLVTSGRGESAWIWDAATREPAAALVREVRQISSAVFLPDGSRIITGGGDDSLVCWDPVDRRPLVVIRSPASMALDISADGRWLVNASTGGQVQVWDAGTPTERRADRLGGR